MPRVKYSLQQKIFTYDYVKKNYKVCRRKFRRKYPGVQIPSKVTIFNLVKKARTEGIFIDKHDKVKRFLTEGKLDDVAYFLQHSVNKSLRRLGQEAGISKACAWKATKLLKFRASGIMVSKIFFLVIALINNHHQNVLPKGRSFTANAGIV